MPSISEILNEPLYGSSCSQVEELDGIRKGDVVFLLGLYDTVGGKNWLLDGNRSEFQLQMYDVGTVTNIDNREEYPFSITFERRSVYGGNLTYAVNRREISLTLDQTPTWEV